MRHALKLHPDSRSKAVTAITVEVERRHPLRIDLHYVAEGDMDNVLIPRPAAESKHRDELWRHTCFEAFLREPDGPAYVEFNLSPSTEYAVYGFTGYREGMHNIAVINPKSQISVEPEQLEIRISFWMEHLTEINPKGPLRFGISAIIEEEDGTKSYWALAHPQGKPDFHHADSFAIELPPPEQT